MRLILTALSAVLLTAGGGLAQPPAPPPAPALQHAGTPAASVFTFKGTAAEQATLSAPIAKINFPWDLLKADMQAQGIGAIEISFAPLNASSALRGRTFLGATEIRPYFRAADRKPATALAALKGIAGQAWPGGIQIDTAYVNDPAAVEEILGYEIAHEVDFFYLESRGMEEKLNALLHPGGPDKHTWWWGNYSRDYFGQPGESWMSGFRMAYAGQTVADDRFSHQFTAAMVPQIRAILGTEQPPPPPPIPPQPPIPPGNFTGMLYYVNGQLAGVYPGMAPAQAPGLDAAVLTESIRAKKIDPLVIFMDALAIYTAYKSGDYAAVAVAVAKLIADLQGKAPTAAAKPVARGGVKVAAAKSPEPPKAPDPSKAAVGVWCPTGFGGSGTCVASDGGKSLVVTNRHVVEGTPVGGRMSVTIGDGSRLPATLLSVSRGADLALVVVDGTLPVAELATAEPPRGAPVRQWGRDWRGQGRPVFKTGLALGFSGARVGGSVIWESTIDSISGDSGAGVFDADGKLVAVCWGGGSGHAQCAVGLADVAGFLRSEARLHFPRLAAAADRVRAEKAAPSCPNGVCPAPPAFLPVPANPPKAMAAAAPCPCTATSCTQGAPCPCTAGNCTCNPPAASRRAFAGCLTAGPSAAGCSAGREPRFPRLRAAWENRPRLIFR